MVLFQACAPSTFTAKDDKNTSFIPFAFGREILCGLPCLRCTSLSQMRQLLEKSPGRRVDTSKGDTLHVLVSLLKRTHRAFLMKESAATSQQQPPKNTEVEVVSFYDEWPSETKQFIFMISELLNSILPRYGEEWRTYTQTAAILGHSLVELWAFKHRTFTISSFLSNSEPLFTFKAFHCVHCRLDFPADAIEERRLMVQLSLDGKKIDAHEQLHSLQSSHEMAISSKIKLLNKSAKEAEDIITGAVSSCGVFSNQVWQALQLAARLHSERDKLSRKLRGDEGKQSEMRAIRCMQAGLSLSLVTCSLGLAQNEIFTQLFRVALMQAMCDERKKAKELAERTLDAGHHLFGPYSVNKFFAEQYLRCLQEGF